MINIHTYSPKDYFGSNCYIIEINGEYAVVDPSVEYASVLADIPDMAEKIKYILLTHAHFDHILKINSWSDACRNIIVGAEDASALSDAYLNCYLGFLGVTDGYYGEYRTVKDGDVLELGGENIRVIGCPGHSPGGVSYRIRDVIFCGDTVFEKGGYGRCDLPGGDIDVLEKTLIKLLTHEKEAVFYPGHGGITTLRELINYFS